MILPRTNIKVNKGFFIPVNLELIARTNLKTAAVYGAVLRYALMKNKSGDINGMCYASIATIAGDLGLSYKTARKYLAELAKGGYIYDFSSGVRNKSHILRVIPDDKIDKSSFLKLEINSLKIFAPHCEKIKPLTVLCVFAMLKSYDNIDVALSKAKITEMLKICPRDVIKCLIVLNKCNLITHTVKGKSHRYALEDKEKVA